MSAPDRVSCHEPIEPVNLRELMKLSRDVQVSGKPAEPTKIKLFKKWKMERSRLLTTSHCNGQQKHSFKTENEE